MVSPLFVWPTWIQNLLPARPTIQVELYGAHDAAGPTPDARIDFLGRIPLTRPSSPSEASECDSECDSECIFKIGNEPQPLLVMLPAEIRQQIWKDVLGGFVFHLKLERRRLKGWVCLSPDPLYCNSAPAWHCRTSRLDGRHIISLFLTCRQIYLEAIEYLYSSNAFIVSDADVMEYLPLILLPQRINAIQNLRFTWSHRTKGPPLGPYKDTPAEHQEVDTRRQIRWCTIWHNLSQMQNLRKLHVRLDIVPLFWQSLNAESARILLEPIRDVTGPEEFILILPFPAMDERKPAIKFRWSAVDGWQGVDPWEGLPCRIQRVDWNLRRT